MTILVFKSMEHYSWYAAQVNFGKTLTCENGRQFEAPRQFMIKIKEIDWSFYQRKMSDWKEAESCPLCFWNARRLAYPAPKRMVVNINETDTRQFMLEQFALCPCRLYDSDYVDMQGKRGEERDWVIDHRDNFSHLHIDWDGWCRKIRSHESFAPRIQEQAEDDQYAPVF